MTQQKEVDLSRPTLTPIEAANFLGLGRNTVYDAIKRGEIPSIRIGKAIRVPTASLKAMVGISA